MEENTNKFDKVTANLKGGLGNYMFQIAAAEAYGLKHNKHADYSFEMAMKAHKDIRLYSDNILRYAEESDWGEIQHSHTELEFEYNEIPFLKHNVMLNGYFQSEKYFIEFEEEIREMFSESEETTKYINQKYGKLLDSKDLTSIHVRRGDYKKYPEYHPMLNMQYYKNAINILIKRGKKSFLVFSDDLEWCRKNFTGPFFKDIEIIYCNNEFDYIDMYLMSRCKNNIIANSSFSWWAAWLNNNPGKKVIAPKDWFGRALKTHNISDLLPGNWRRILCK